MKRYIILFSIIFLLSTIAGSGSLMGNTSSLSSNTIQHPKPPPHPPKPHPVKKPPKPSEPKKPKPPSKPPKPHAPKGPPKPPPPHHP